MGKIIKSKYNSTGERCVNACLNYGEVRYKNDDDSPVCIEIPSDKYEEAISDFIDRVKEGNTSEALEPRDILRRGAFTYNQVKNIANEGKIKGLEFYDIDGSVESLHILGVSGSIEYALAIWNSESRENAILKGIVRAIKVFGEEFIQAINLDESYDVDTYLKFAKGLYSFESMIDMDLFEMKNYVIESNGYGIGIAKKDKFTKNMNLPTLAIGGVLGFLLVQLFTGFGKTIGNNAALLLINFVSIVIFALLFTKISKFITDKYVSKSTNTISELFNEELEKVCTDNLLTEKESYIIVKNITKGEVTKLLMDMKGSVNKKISSNTIVNKETKFILDARKLIILPTEHEIKHALHKLVNSYEDKLHKEYNVSNVLTHE